MPVSETMIHAAARRAHPVFIAEGWTWAGGEGHNGMPTLEQLEEQFRSLVAAVDRLTNQEPGEVNFASCGRLVVDRFIWADDPDPEYRLCLDLLEADELYPNA